MIGLENPWFLLLLAVVPLWLWGRRSFLKPPALHFPCEELIKNVAGKGRARWAGIPLFLKLAGFLLLLVGLARPVWIERNRTLEREGIDMFLLLDVSSSMSEKVLDGTRSNLDVARDVIRGFVKSRTEDRIGLISFARFPKLVCPLTMDKDAVVAFIDRLQCIPQGSEMDGTAIGAALAEAARRFEKFDNGKEEEADRVVVLMTDGEENQFYVDPGEAAKLCADLKMKVYTVSAARSAPGEDKEGEEAGLADKLHEEIARITGGRFAKASSAGDLGDVYTGIDTLEKRPLEERHYSERHDLFRWFLLPAGILLFLEFLFARILCLRMP